MFVIVFIFVYIKSCFVLFCLFCYNKNISELFLVGKGYIPNLPHGMIMIYPKASHGELRTTGCQWSHLSPSMYYHKFLLQDVSELILVPQCLLYWVITIFLLQDVSDLILVPHFSDLRKTQNKSEQDVSDLISCQRVFFVVKITF